MNITTVFKGTKFLSHKTHNPSCDILEGTIDDDCYITYVIEVNGPKKGQEAMEYYRGKNYVVGSRARSYSRIFSPANIPVKYYTRWQLLRSIYENLQKPTR